MGNGATLRACRRSEWSVRMMTESPLVDVPSAAACLSVSESTVRRLLKSGDLPARRVGRQLRFETAVLLSYSAPVETLAQAGSTFDFEAAFASVRYPR